MSAAKLSDSCPCGSRLYVTAKTVPDLVGVHNLWVARHDGHVKPHGASSSHADTERSDQDGPRQVGFCGSTS